jgi:triacylglycerol esterase/lipase EstA (alpha/beta hydrolase family)
MPIIAGRASAAYGAGFGAVTTIPSTLVGSYDALASVTVGSTAVSTVNFIGIPLGYNHLQIRYMVKSSRNPNNNPLDELNLRMNGNSGNHYTQHCLFGNGGSAQSNAVITQNNMELGSGFIGDLDSGSQFGIGIVDILDYSSTSKTKVVKTFGGIDFNGVALGAGGRVGQGSGIFNLNAPIQSLTFYAENGNIIQYSQFDLYGVR